MARLSNGPRIITDEEIRALVGHLGRPLVSSLYLDTDGARRIRAEVETAFDRLAGHLKGQARARADAALLGAVEKDLKRMRDWLGSGGNRSTVRGLAFFSDSQQDWFEVLPLPWPVADGAALGRRPRVARLMASLDEHRPLLVGLIDRRRLRLFAFQQGTLEELLGLTDVEPRAVDTGIETGRFEHHREEGARLHFRRAAKRIETEMAAGAWERWIIGGPDEAVEGLEEELPQAVRRRLAGRISVPVSAPIDELARAAKEAAKLVNERRENETVRRLGELTGPGQVGVAGLAATLAALNDRRVGTFLVAADFSAPGAYCPACGYLGVDVDVRRCPRCGTTSVADDDIVELAVDEAVEQRSTVHFLRMGGLDQFGKIAAIDRF